MSHNKLLIYGIFGKTWVRSKDSVFKIVMCEQLQNLIQRQNETSDNQTKTQAKYINNVLWLC